jgi:hypothetical protein
MAVFVRFNIFSEDLSEKVHQLDTDTLRVYLSNGTPSASANAVKTDLAEISTGNGYTGAVDTQNATSRTGLVTSITGVDVVVTATGAVGPFRYVVLYNDTPTAPADPLIGYWDYGSAISLASGETFTIDFSTSMFTVG